MAWRLYYQTQATNASGALTADNTPSIHASTNVTITGTPVSATFTAPDLVSSVYGISVYVTAKGTGGTVTFNFQEATVTKASTAAVNVTSLIVGQWNYIPLTAPFTYTSITASNERWTITTSGLTGTTTFAQASTANFAYMSWSNRNSGSAAASTDDIFCVRPIGTAAITVTNTGTQLMGSGLQPTQVPTSREINFALYISDGVTYKMDTTANTTCQIKGVCHVNTGGELQAGTTGTPYPSSFTATIAFDPNGAASGAGIRATDGGKVTLQGSPKSSTTLWKTTLASGVGTAASPLVVNDAVDWSVGDEIYTAPTSNNATNYNEGETKFIITKNSSTSYVLSNTSGGGEAAYTYTHSAGAYVVNLSRNVILKSTSAFAWYGYFQSSTTDEVNLDWVRVETTGAFLGGTRDGLRLVNNTTNKASFDYSVIYKSAFNGVVFAVSSVAQTHNGIVSYGALANTGFAQVAGLVIQTNCSNRTWNDLVCIDNQAEGIVLSGNSQTFNRGIFIANMKGSATTTDGGVRVAGGNNAFNNCEFHCNRVAAVMSVGDVNGYYNYCVFGTKGYNAADYYTSSQTIALAFLNNCTLGSTSTIVNYLNSVASSRISLQAYNGTSTNHVTYTTYGTIQSTGAGLTDTTVRTAGTLNVRIAPEDATTGTTFSYLIPAIVGRAVQTLGFIKLNAAFTGDAGASCVVNLYMPGSTTPDATTTISKADNNYNVFSLAYNYAGSIDGFARVDIVAKTTTASAYAYVADIMNGTNTITALKPWVNGLPSPVMFEQLGDAAAVWQVLTSALTTSGTTGVQLKKALTTAKFLGLK